MIKQRAEGSINCIVMGLFITGWLLSGSDAQGKVNPSLDELNQTMTESLIWKGEEERQIAISAEKLKQSKLAISKLIPNKDGSYQIELDDQSWTFYVRPNFDGSFVTIIKNDYEECKWEYDSNRRIQKKCYWDKNGQWCQTVQVNPCPLSMNDIVHDCPQSYRSQAEDLLNQTNRELITVVDSGVDYNHPVLASKIPNRFGNERKLAALQSQLDEEMTNQQKWTGPNVSNWQRQSHIAEQKLAESADRIKGLKKELEEKAFGFDFVDGDYLPFDFVPRRNHTYDHGTGVAYIATKSPSLALLPIRIPMRFQRSAEKGNYLEKAVETAYMRGSRIVNFSFGQNTIDNGVKRAIEKHPDVLFVVAAANREPDENQNVDEKPSYPESLPYPNILAVASVDSNLKLSNFSSWGPKSVDVAAPGEGVPIIYPGGSFNSESLETRTTDGTSFAAPYVAALAGQILHENPGLCPEQIVEIIGSTVDQTPELKERLRFGGVVNPTRALEKAKQLKQETK